MDINFLLICKNENMVPKFIHNVKIHSLFLDEDSSKFKKKLLRRSIENERRTRKIIYEELYRVRLLLFNIVGIDYFRFCVSYVLKCFKSDYLQKLHSQTRKLNDLRKIFGVMEFNVNNTIINKSDLELSKSEINVLKFGFNHGIKTRVNEWKIKCKVESLFNHISNDDIIYNENLKTDLRRATDKYISKNKKLKLNDEKLLLKLKKHEICISKFDKGNGVFIQNKSDYLNKMYSILNTNKFSVIDNKRKNGLPIPIKDEKNINLMINNFIKSNDLNSTLKNSLLAQGSQPSKLYGLPKVHKTDIPMRPVLSMIGSAQYNVAKTLVKLLKPLINNPLECKDSFEFVEKIINLEVNSESETMVSFDVVNLFTNIPLEETIQLCVDLWDELVEDKSKSMSTKALKALLEFSTKNVPFLFNDDWYMQIDGVAMGSPLAPLMASIFLQNLEQKFKNFTGELPIFYTRYVDDTFLIFKKKENVNSFLNFINNLHPNINFTCESEINNKISFLDVLIEKKQNRFMTGVYRKPTDTGLYSTPSSFCDPKYNRNMIKGLVHRVWSLTSSFEIFDKEIDTLHNRLSNNGYNKKYLNNIIKNTVESIYLKSKDKINKNLNATDEEIYSKKIYLKIPYFENAWISNFLLPHILKNDFNY